MMAAVRTAKQKVQNGCAFDETSNFAIGILNRIAGAVVYKFYKVFISIER